VSGRAYDAIRAIVERLGGTMIYERRGHRHGAWVIRIGDKSATIEAEGKRSFPPLDRLYVQRVPRPKHWDDYSGELVQDAEPRLLSFLNISSLSPPPSLSQVEGLAALIERTKWKFGWSYARTYPHEYTTKDLCRSDDHARLIDLIELYGVVERFGDSLRKYFYFEERKYWHMGEPHSHDPQKRPNVINRTWVDVRRHADNVRHVWTAEEVELQLRLWEIQLEKSTDRPKS
jgi:hypothetical protein